MQRGQPAVVDKWSRTLMALKAGIDLVIELPVIYCAQSAEIFAYGSVSLLNSLGIVDSLCFGSECGNIGILRSLAEIISLEPPEYKEYLKQEVGKGLPFAVSRANALIRYIEAIGSAEYKTHPFENICDIKSILQSSNNILGMEYIKWLMRLKSSIVPFTIERVHAGYNDESLNKPLASATALRKAIMQENAISIKKHMPEFASDVLYRQFAAGMGPVFLESFTHPILCNLRRMSIDEISHIGDVGEGLENRIKKAAISSCTMDELIGRIKSKRYAETRIRRILINSLLGIRNSDIELYKAMGPQYVRVLGFSKKGRELLSQIKKKCSLPIITNVGGYKKYGNKYLNRMIEMDILSTDIYVTAYSNPSFRRGGYDFYAKPVTV